MVLTITLNFTGSFPMRILWNIITVLSIFILPSISSKQEGFGIVVLEAMACQTPVISTEIVGVADDVKKSNSGIIIPPKDVEKLSEAIIKILECDNPEILGINGRKLVKNKYTWSGIAEKTEKLYNKLI